jgi:hypothetical protein
MSDEREQDIKRVGDAAIRDEREQDIKQVGRVAIRVEGEQIVARYAMPDTMDGAVWLASVSLHAANQDALVFAKFREMAKLIVDTILEEATGKKPAWSDPVGAPEHERAGRG